MDTLWFEVAMVSALFALGNILFGHFEEQTPKFKRIIKFFLMLVLIVGSSVLFSRTIAIILMVISIIPALYIHLIYLPKKGINGWTAEPKEKYYELRGWDKSSLKTKKNMDEAHLNN